MVDQHLKCPVLRSSETISHTRSPGQIHFFFTPQIRPANHIKYAIRFDTILTFGLMPLMVLPDLKICIYIGVVFLQQFAQHLIETFGWLAEEIEGPAKSAWGNFLYELPLDGLCDEAAEIFATRRINTWKMYPDYNPNCVAIYICLTCRFCMSPMSGLY